MSTLLPDGVFIKHPTSLFIGGRWVEPAAGNTLEIESPHTQQVCAVVGEARETDMDAAVAAARRAFDKGPWPRMPVAERAAYLRRMREILDRRRAELESAYVAQVGVLKTFAPFAIAEGNRNFTTYADVGETFAWETRTPSPGSPGDVGHVVREPLGVVAAIAPWNLPLAIMTSKVAPALICGCTVIMKPAPETPLEAYIVAEAAEEAGLPAGVINLAPSHREAADHLVCNPGVDKIAFTGSTLAGKRIASVAGQRIARVTLELGGKSPAIVLDDFPAEEAGRILARATTVLTGQVCALLSRAIVPESLYEEIADTIVSEMRRVKIGSPLDPTTQMGPVAMKRQLARVEGYIEKGLAEGARLATGGHRPAHLDVGYYIEPTLFTQVNNQMTLAREEIFGPVLALIPAKNLEQAVEIANDTHYGLNAAVFSHDRQKVYQVGRQLHAGNVAHNGLKADFHFPLGGFKQSGIGREGGGGEALLSYTECKTMLIAAENA